MPVSRIVRPPALVGGFALSALIGVLEALYGPLIPSLRATFNLDPGAAGLLVSAHFCGGILGMLAWGAAPAFLGTRARIAVGPLAVAMGCLGLAAVPEWLLALPCAAAIGFGCGLLDVGINTLYAAGYGDRSAAIVNLLNAAFGVGAISAPIAIGLAPEAGYRPAFLLAGLFALTLLPTLLPAGPQAAAAESTRSTTSHVGRRPALLTIAGFVALYGLALGVEAAVASWAPTHLLSLGYEESTASLAASLYWAGLIAGRLLAAPISLRIRPEVMLPATLGGAALALLLAQTASLAPIAYALTGMFLAPFFAGGLVWLVRLDPSSASASSLAMAGGSLGSALLPALVGWLIGLAGTSLTPLAIAAFTVAAALVALALGWADRSPLARSRTS